MSDATKIKYENVQQVLQVFRSADRLTKAEIKAQRKIKEKYRRKNNSAVDLIRKVQKR